MDCETTTESVPRSTGLSTILTGAPLDRARYVVSPPVSTTSASRLRSARIAVTEPLYGVTCTSRPASLKKPLSSAKYTPTVVMAGEDVGSPYLMVAVPPAGFAAALAAADAAGFALAEAVPEDAAAVDGLAAAEAAAAGDDTGAAEGAAVPPQALASSASPAPNAKNCFASISFSELLSTDYSASPPARTLSTAPCAAPGPWPGW